MQEFMTGFGAVFKGLRLLPKPGIRPFVLIPLLINIIVFTGLAWGGSDYFDAAMEKWLPDWLSFLEWILWPLFALAFVLLLFYTFTMVANLIGAPFNGLLSEKVEAHLSGSITESSGSFMAIVKDILPSLLSELRKLSYFLIRALPLLLLFIIPGINLIAPLVWLLFSAWYMGIEYADFPLGNRGMKFPQQLQALKKKRMRYLGFGLGVTLLLLIPVVNFVAMPAAVCGVTWLVVKKGVDA